MSITLENRVAAMESFFGTVNLGDWSNDQSVPYWLAWKINPAARQFQTMQASIVSAVQLVAQAKINGKQGEGLTQFASHIVDDWCPTRPPVPPWPRPHWTDYIQALGHLADTYAANSALREAAFDLGRRVMDRAHAAGREN